MTVLLVGGVAWVGAHDLDPRKPISSSVTPVNVQVVSLDWKWLFIYPEQGIASVNKLVVPVGTPISFELTSSSVMNSFFVPQLGSQIYTMSGMVTRLHLQADHLGTYPGLSAMFSGDGFPDMRFTVDAVTDDRFAQWVRETRDTGSVLDKQSYADLVKPSKAVAPFTYRAVAADLFSSIVNTAWAADDPSQSDLFNLAEGRAMNLLGKLDWNAIPLHEPIIMGATGFMVLVVLVVLGFITTKGAWLYLWREWLTSVDHKRIGAMYCILALVMMLRGFSDAIMIRAQQALAAGGAQGYLPPEHFDQIFSAHGTIMILFMAMPFVVGTHELRSTAATRHSRCRLPDAQLRQLLADRLGRAVGQHFAGGRRVLKSRLVGLSATERIAILARRRRRLLSLVAANLRSRHLAGGNEFRHNHPENAGTGHGLYAHAGLLLDRACRQPAHCRGFSGPDRDARDAAARSLSRLSFLHARRRQGNQMLYVNLFWVWGHPEVYILILPAFGVFSEVIATFSGKPLFGYRSMVAATMAICVLSFLVWLHHFFTMGASANVNGFFGVMTMIIAVPTGAKVFNWLFTMYGGRVRFEVPVLWSIGFMVTFVIGGMTGVLMAVPPADFQLHNSVFLIAHFHNVIIGGVVFGVMAGYNYWFPKAFGFKLDERWGRASFWCWLIGFYVAFMPLYLLGLMGMTRRMQHYDNLSWQPWLIVAMIGTVIILVGIVCQVVQLVVSIRNPRGSPRDRTIRGTAARSNGRRPHRRRHGILPSSRRSPDWTRSGAANSARARTRTSPRRHVITSRSKCRRTAQPALSPPSSPSSSALR